MRVSGTARDPLFDYFVVGRSQRTSEPVHCSSVRDRPDPKHCHHEWLVVADQTVQDPEKLKAAFVDLAMLPPTLMDRADPAHMVFGTKYNWCWLCGCYLESSPGSPSIAPWAYGDPRL